MSSSLSNAVLTWIPAPRLDSPSMTGTFWTFGPLDSLPYASFLVLAPRGLIGNYQNVNEDLWQIIDGKLSFVSERGTPTTIFDMAQFRDGEIVALKGPVLLPGFDVIHELRRTGHPAHPLNPTPSWIERKATFLRSPDRRRRENLVVARAGNQSLHSHWLVPDPGCGRNWDLCISYYGREMTGTWDEADYFTHQPSQRKFQAIYDLFHPASPLWEYERIWLPDDDLLIGCEDINRLFHATRKYDLDLAQPSLIPGPDSFISHAITAQRPATILRFVDFVEVMCPLFSRQALQICVGTFRDSVSGFGLDYLWPSLIGGPRTRLAIIDLIGAKHTRPVGSNFDFDQTLKEERGIVGSYRLRYVSLSQLAVVR